MLACLRLHELAPIGIKVGIYTLPEFDIKCDFNFTVNIQDVFNKVYTQDSHKACPPNILPDNKHIYHLNGIKLWKNTEASITYHVV